VSSFALLPGWDQFIAKTVLDLVEARHVSFLRARQARAYKMYDSPWP